MAKYIDADKAISAICEECNGGASLECYPCTEVRRIEKIPAADVQEIRHGRWTKQNPLVDTEECSLCGYNIIDEEFETPFCPWCGAQMDIRG